MSNVTLKIGGRNYAVACAPGEEAHIMELGELIDGKVTSMGIAGGQNEVRSLLFASLLLADELCEVRKGGHASAPNPATAAAAAAAQDDDALLEIAPALERIASRLENLALQIENT